MKENKERVLREKFTLISPEEILAPLLLFGTEFSAAFDSEFDVVLYEGKLFTEEQFETVDDIIDLPSTVQMVSEDELFIHIPDTVTNINEFWDYIESIN